MQPLINTVPTLCIICVRTYILQPQFKEGMMPSFAHILLEVLVQKSHDLIREEVCLCLYGMAAVDFPRFHGETLPSFLSKWSQLREDQRTTLATGYKMDEVGNSPLSRLCMQYRAISSYMCVVLV